MFEECRECEFLVHPDAEYCPDCGVKFPADPEFVEEIEVVELNRTNTLLWMIILGGIFSLLITLVSNGFSKVEFSSSSIFIGFGLGAVVSFFINFTISIRATNAVSRKKLTDERTDTLAYKENEILRTIVELDDTKDSVEYLLSEAADSFEKQRLRKMLEIIDCQKEICHIQENRIELARIENEFMPFAEGLSGLSEEEITGGIESTEYFAEAFDHLRKGFEHIESEQKFRKILAEYEKFRAEVDESERDWQITHEELSNRPESNAQSLEKPGKYSSLSNKIYQTDSIFPPIFDKLEDEYFGLADKSNL